MSRDVFKFGGERPFAEADMVLASLMVTPRPEGLQAVLVRTSETSPKLAGVKLLVEGAQWGVTVSSVKPDFIEESDYNLRLGQDPALVAATKVLQWPDKRRPMLADRFGIPAEVELEIGGVVAVASDMTRAVWTAFSVRAAVLNQPEPTATQDDIFWDLANLLSFSGEDFELIQRTGGITLGTRVGLAASDSATNRGVLGGFESEVKVRPFTLAELVLYVYGYYQGLKKGLVKESELRSAYDYYGNLIAGDSVQLELLDQGVPVEVLRRVAGSILEEHLVVREHIQGVNLVADDDPSFEVSKAVHLRRALGAPLELLELIQEAVYFSRQGRARGDATNDVVSAMKSLIQARLNGSARMPENVGSWGRWRPKR